jgi:biopolymer transport protein ExbD
VAFKKLRRSKKQVELVSFIDMIFILLIFFLLTNFSLGTSYEERRLFLPTPKNELGRSQIVLQVIEPNSMLWLDETASSIVADIEDNLGYLSTQKLNDVILNTLIEKNTFSVLRVNQKISLIVQRADQNPQVSFFVLIRMPDEAPYYLLVDIISKLTAAQFQNIKYGCIAGTLDQLRQCKSIRSVIVEDKQGNRKKNIRIDF